jgi:hypothetical protein
MAFKKLDATAFPPRQWALVGHPGSGKSTFAAQLRGPLLVVDADHRFTEVAGRAVGEVYQLSDNPADNMNAERIAALLREHMADSGIRTVVVDSLTSILSPLVVEAILDNEAGRNKNRVSAFKDKALAMRLLQDTITGWGCDVLWIYHLRTGLDSAVELARLRRSLNLQLRMVDSTGSAGGGRRGIHVEWARRGRSGFTLWDESDHWQGMPEKIEQAVYGGLTPAQMSALEKQKPTSFSGPQEAIAWGYEQGCFNDAVHAQNTYDELKRAREPKSAQAMWSLWLAEVERRCQEQETTWSEPEPVF